jgi:DNA-binding MarR family transcriptional regulator
MKIIDRKKPCTANDIANFLGRDKAQVTRLANTLLERNLISKEPNPDDKRSQYLCITPTGALLVNEIAKIDEKVVSMMTKNIKEEELRAFEKVADLMANNLEDQ